MAFRVRLADRKEKKLFSGFFQNYLDELSHFPGEKTIPKDQNGIYSYPYLEAYWQDGRRFPYLLFNENKIAGFALIRQDGPQWEIAEFYVFPEFRHHGLATTCAIDIFRKHPGNWRIVFNKSNKAGRALWQKLAEHLCGKNISVGKSDDNLDYIAFRVDFSRSR